MGKVCRSVRQNLIARCAEGPRDRVPSCHLCGGPLGHLRQHRGRMPKLAQTPTACPLPHSLPTATHLASDIYLTSGANGIELAHCHIACSLPHSLLTATQLANGFTDRQLQRLTSCHRACQLSYSSLMMYRSPTATELTSLIPIFPPFPQLPPFLCRSYQAAPPQSSFPTTTTMI